MKVSKVAVVRTKAGVSKAYQHALKLIGGLDDFKSSNITVKVGIYDKRNLNYPTIQVLKTVVNSFIDPTRVLVVESDNHNGMALERLRVWREIFSDKVMPFSLSDDTNTNVVNVCGEKVNLSSVLFKPNKLVSLHVLRKGTAGCIFKNLLGLVPDIRKERFHEKLGQALVDMAEAVGWIDLAVIDGTYIYGAEWKEGEPLEREQRDLLIVGRDPVAVETVGSILAGEDPFSIPSIAVAHERKLGEADINRIEVLGKPINNII